MKGQVREGNVGEGRFVDTCRLAWAVLGSDCGCLDVRTLRTSESSEPSASISGS